MICFCLAAYFFICIQVQNAKPCCPWFSPALLTSYPGTTSPSLRPEAHRVMLKGGEGRTAGHTGVGHTWGWGSQSLTSSPFPEPIIARMQSERKTNLSYRGAGVGELWGMQGRYLQKRRCRTRKTLIEEEQGIRFG